MKPAKVLDESPREREILDIIYSRGPSSVQEVKAHLSAPPSYSAVRTMLTRLVSKGHLHFKRDGTRYVYSPAIKQATVQKQAMRRVLNTYFGGSLTKAVTALIDDRSGKISAEEAKEIQRLLSAARKEGR